jgi:hypothetical protein
MRCLLWSGMVRALFTCALGAHWRHTFNIFLTPLMPLFNAI